MSDVIARSVARCRESMARTAFQFAHLTCATEFYAMFLSSTELQMEVMRLTTGTKRPFQTISRTREDNDGGTVEWYPPMPVQEILEGTPDLFSFLCHTTCHQILMNLDGLVRTIIGSVTPNVPRTNICRTDIESAGIRLEKTPEAWAVRIMIDELPIYNQYVTDRSVTPKSIFDIIKLQTEVTAFIDFAAQTFCPKQTQMNSDIKNKIKLH